MSQIDFDLTTRKENKPQDCGKRTSYNEFIYGNKYYLLYNGELHKVTVDALQSIGNSTKLKVTYLQEETLYLGEQQDESYLIDLGQMMPIFYETK